MEPRLLWDGGRTEQPTDISAYQAAIGVERGRLVPVRPARILGDTETRLAWTRLMVGQGVFFANAKKSLRGYRDPSHPARKLETLGESVIGLSCAQKR